MYTIIYSQTAEKQLSKLKRDVQERVISTLERIRIRPEAYVKRLVGQSCYGLRVGDYRVLLDIDNDKIMILILKIGHRKNVYDSL